MKRYGIVLQSYRSLRDGKAFDHPVIQQIAQSHHPSMTPAQVMGRWCIQKGFIYVPKSVKKERMIENSHVLSTDNNMLSPEEMLQLDQLTTPAAIDAFYELYKKCVNRDTTMDGTLDGVKLHITKD
jgi:diketogulonate reductase-like aldo/keto reductase